MNFSVMQRFIWTLFLKRTYIFLFENFLAVWHFVSKDVVCWMLKKTQNETKQKKTLIINDTRPWEKELPAAHV